MDLLANLQLLSQYNSWMNQKVYQAAQQLDEEQIKQDQGAFFGSIFATLNHIYVADIIWLKRFSRHSENYLSLNDLPPIPSYTVLNEIVTESFIDLWQLRQNLDNLIINWPNFDKGVLLLIFGAFCQVSAIKWYLVSYFSAENAVWINADFFFIRIISVVMTLIIFIIIVGFSFRYKRNRKFRRFISYFSPIFFGGTMISAGYTIGIYSPATIAGFINIVLIGLYFIHEKLFIVLRFLLLFLSSLLVT